jgi:nudix-type nucleoside diphosphatase (YffH/AdpP family)
MCHTRAEIVATETKHRGWSALLVATIRLPDGSTITREIEDHGNAVCVLPYDPVRRTAVLVQQMRAPVLFAAKRPHFLEAVAGLIDAEEAPESSARRETMEEAGLRMRWLDHVVTAWTMPGISTEQIDLFLGEYTEADRVNAGGGIEDESIQVFEMPLAELAAMADAGTLADMKTLVLLQTLRLRRPDLFTPA